MIKQHHKGGRMQNYYPTPVRYTVSSGEVEDREWGARLAGILYMVTGGVLLLGPVIRSLGGGSQILFGVLGPFAFMTRPPSLPVAVVFAAILIPVGAGVVARWGPAFYPAMAVAFFMFMPSFPVGTAVGCVLLYVLWQGMPRSTPAPPTDPEDPDPETT